MATNIAPPSRKPGGPGQPWSDVETTHLISAYAEKWYSLKRGPLKAQQWEDVASAVAARCGLRTPSKNGTQCRHKMEKLRKRYRAERKLPIPSRWPHFDLMDRMERGSLPVSAHPAPVADDSNGSNDEEEVRNGEDDGDDDDEEAEEEDDTPAGFINNIGGRRTMSVGGVGRGENWGFHTPRVSGNDGEEGRGGLAMELATSVRRFAEQFQRIEKRRMELMVELERDWMEMETRRMQMVIESQQYLVKAIATASSHCAKKAKRSA